MNVPEQIISKAQFASESIKNSDIANRLVKSTRKPTPDQYI